MACPLLLVDNICLGFELLPGHVTIFSPHHMSGASLYSDATMLQWAVLASLEHLS